MSSSSDKDGRSAARFLDSLIDEQEPDFEPPDTARWAEAFLDEFRRFRDAQRGHEAQRMAERFGKTAAADLHRFFWELWQNADDAGATELIFEVDNACLTVSNNGRPFSPAEVFALLMVAGSTKEQEADPIGRFGVGSLALMRFSDTPVYRSGHYAFELQRSYTYPGPDPLPGGGYVHGLRLVAPLCAGTDPDDLWRELSDRVDDEALLYMRHLQRVTVSRVGGEAKSTEAHVQYTGAGARVTIGARTWLRYDREALPPPGMRRDDGTEISKPVRIALTRDAAGTSSASLVYAFFPTQKRHNYPWGFSAPFDLTTSREDLIPSEFNRWVLREIGRSMVQAAIDPSVGNPSAPWEIVPLASDAHELLSEIWQGALDEMRSAAWLPASRRFLRACDAAFPESEEVRALLKLSDMSDAARAPRRWIDGVPPAKARPALEEAGAFRVCCHTLSAVLATGPSRRGPDWYFRALGTVIKVMEERGDDEVRVRLIDGRCLLNRRGQPFSLGAAGRAGQVVCNARSEVLSRRLGELFKEDLVILLHKVYRLSDRRSDDQKDAVRQRIDAWLKATQSEQTYSYESHLDAPAFIRHFVVDRKLAAEGGEIADGLLGFVRDQLEAYLSEQVSNRRQQSLSRLGGALYMKAHQWSPDGVRLTAYRPISEINLPAHIVDSSAWPDAARGVPGLWWADASYKSRLVRKNNPLGVARFLRELGASIGPPVERAELNYWHGPHPHFHRVTHNDRTSFPNFPHDAAQFGQFTDYGLEGEADSRVLQLWWNYVSGLSDAERIKRGQALLRVLEDQWDSTYGAVSTAQAFGYYANGRYPLGDVPTRWLWRLQTWPWAAVEGGGFAPPRKIYARTREALTLLKPDQDALCAWEVRNVAATRALRFCMEVPSSVALRYLQDARSREVQISELTARSYYEHLAGHASTLPGLAAAFDAGLVYSPGSHQSWWRPPECVRADQREIFGGLCGYVDAYPAESLWNALGIVETADLNFLADFWRRVAHELEPTDPELRRALQRSYVLAEHLTGAASPSPRTIPVIARDEWHPSSEVFATDLHELADQLASDGLWRWDGGAPQLVPHFLDWIGLLDVRHAAHFALIAGNVCTEPSPEQQVHQGVVVFAKEVSAARPDLLNAALKERIREIVHGRVQVIEPLRLRVSISHKKLGEREYEVSSPAFYRGGNLFLSRLTKPSDRAVAFALLADVPLSPNDSWAALNLLQLCLNEQPTGEWSMPTDLLADDFPVPAKDEESASGAPETPASSPQTSAAPYTSYPGHMPAAQPPAHPVDQYEVESDAGGDEPGSGKGGLEPRRTVKLRSPGSGGGSGGDSSTMQRSPKSTEERAVQLYQHYVLDPAGIAISDQRLHPGVGADLIGDDHIFRELKAHSEAAPSEVSLTEHEYKRSSNKGKQYELVIVEHVWAEPTIIVIPAPLDQLRYRPSGGVVVRGWRELTPQPRIIHLRRNSRRPPNLARELAELQAALDQARQRADGNHTNWQQVMTDFALYKRQMEQERGQTAQAAYAALVLNIRSAAADLEQQLQHLDPSLEESAWIEGVRQILRKLNGVLDEAESERTTAPNDE